MTDEQINRRIAKWLGWTKVDLDSVHIWQAPKGDGRCQQYFPAYTTDLNACAEFEAKLIERHLDQSWVWRLGMMFGVDEVGDDGSGAQIHPEHLFDFATATARQRCEALLRVIGEKEANDEES